MNIVGKILVVLNLVFALVVGGFLIIDFVTRTNWRNYGEALKRELEVRDANMRAMTTTNQELAKQNKDAVAKLDEEKTGRKTDEIVAKVQIDDANRKRDEAEVRQKEADLTAQQAAAEAGRLKEEVKNLLAVIQKRDQALLVLQEDNNGLRAKAVANENMAKATIVRNQNLLDRLMDLQKILAEKESGTPSATTVATDPNRPNPPGTYIKAKVDKVDPDGLVKITAGSDDGLKVNHTLEVYRLKPQADYLGMIRIVDVKHHEAVGRLVRNSFTAANARIREGDQVASSLGRP